MGILMQLKTGHIGLNAHLKRIGVNESMMCEACSAYDETINHVLRHHQAYERQRQTLRNKLR